MSRYISIYLPYAICCRSHQSVCVIEPTNSGASTAHHGFTVNIFCHKLSSHLHLSQCNCTPKYHSHTLAPSMYRVICACRADFFFLVNITEEKRERDTTTAKKILLYETRFTGKLIIRFELTHIFIHNVRTRIDTDDVMHYSAMRDCMSSEWCFRFVTWKKIGSKSRKKK